MSKQQEQDRKSIPSSTRSAGILLHVSSLPSAFGCGDLGPEAKAFADFLKRSNQSYWQLLPLNPSEADQGFSPYSAISSMAGNTLFISPEVLVKDGLLAAADVDEYRIGVKKKADFQQATNIRKELLTIAYQNFTKNNVSQFHKLFTTFCRKEEYWLDDFALYVVIKENNESEPWYKWPEKYRLRNKEALVQFQKTYHEELNKVKWEQFTFFTQWHRLKEYCNEAGIRMFGDLPYYVSYDSADVWAHQEIFKLDEKGNMKGIAGVPPDYFNENGQLWGMPVFRWSKIKENNYEWWINRVRKNMELFDLIRFDHFRAFSSYWEVPAGKTTAINGKWKQGPGSAFFKSIKDALGELPFVAEDLGDIDEAVYELRDEFRFPGMKVLQFAFGENLPESEHIPHNYDKNFIAYTGTHDNNTSIGWYKEELSAADLNRVKKYIGERITVKNIHKKLGKMVYASVADVAILPMQDVLGLGEKSRMNIPASTEGNWLWRLKPFSVSKKLEKRLTKWATLYNRRGSSGDLE